MPAETTTAEEQWRPVVGWEGLYEVSDQGRMRGLPRTLRHGHRWPGKVLAAKPDSHGYPRATLNRNGKTKYIHVHLLVLTAFAGPCPAGLECRHLDGNRSNCRLSNLKWGSHAENMENIRRHGTRPVGEQHGQSKIKPDDVLAIRSERGQPLCVTAARFGISKQQVSKIQRREKWRHL